MKPAEHTNAALAILLFGGTIVSPALAQNAAVDPGKPTPGAALNYVGGDTRIGIGWDSELDARGEIYQVLQSNETSATLGELWAAKRSGGLKLSHNWANGGKTAANKVFAAFDITDSDARKFTLGGGQEYKNWFWGTYISKAASGDNLLVDLTTPGAPGFVTGTDAGGDFRQDFNVSQNVKLFTRAFDWGVGARVGHFYAGPLVRLTAGLDYEWGKARSLRVCNNAATVVGASTQPPGCISASGLGGKPTQTTLSLQVEKYFEGSGFSVALQGEALRRKGQLVDDRNDTRGFAMLRYEFGAPKSNFRPSKLTKTVTSTERVPDPNWVAPPAAAPAPAAAQAAPAAAPAPQFRTEKRTSRFDTTDAQETYFDLGSTKLKPAAMRELDAIVARINAQRPYVEIKVRVVGHTCPTGSDRNNFPLSQKRADAVKAYLVSKGVPENVITTEAKAGKSPKYPEVKGQSFRNRRADTDVVIVKEKSEDVRVPIAAVPAPSPSAQPAAPAPAAAAQRPMIDRTVSREVIEDQPDPWLARALRGSVPHKTTVDTYTWSQATNTTTLGAKTYLNRGPAAVNDSVSATCGTPLTINVLGNDTDPDGDSLTITSVTTPGKGTAVISGGRIVYTPGTGAGCTGTDTFSYSVSDGKGGVATANVSVALSPAPIPNNAPIAKNDEYILGCSQSIAPKTYNVLANDSDPDGDTLTITSVTQPSIGAVTIGESGKNVVFTTNRCFSRTSFTYTISDGKGGTSTATVIVVDPF